MASESTLSPSTAVVKPKHDAPGEQSSPSNLDRPSSPPAATSDPPIRFTPESIPKQLTGEFVALMARRFYSDDEWSKFSEYQRTLIVSKAVAFRNHNKSGTDDNMVDMSKPNPYAQVDGKGVESWPSASQDQEYTDVEKNAYMAITWKGVTDKLAQRCWGDRFYHGKINLSQKCSRCEALNIDCKRKDNGVTCFPCAQYRVSRPGPESRCEHLERYYVDYASRHLKIDLPKSLALFEVTGGPCRTTALTQKRKHGLSGVQASASPISRPRLHGSISTSPKHRTSISEPTASSTQKGGADSVMLPNTRVLPSGMVVGRPRQPSSGGYAFRRAPCPQQPEPISPTSSSSSFVMEISRPSTPVPGPSERSELGRSAKRRRLDVNKNVPPTTNTASSAITAGMAQQRDKAPENGKSELQLLQERFDALRSLSQTYFHQVSEVHTRLEISIPSLVTAVEATPQVLEPFMKHKERLRVASLEFCRGLMTVDGPSS